MGAGRTLRSNPRSPQIHSSYSTRTRSCVARGGAEEEEEDDDDDAAAAAAIDEDEDEDRKRP
jgi:hypothetical protein